MSAADDVPKLPRGRGLKYSRQELFRIGLLVITLIGVVLMARPCANAMTDFVMGFDDQDGANSMPRSGTVDRPAGPQQFEQLSPDMSEEEIKAAIERSKTRSQGAPAPATGTGSAAAPSGPATGSAAAPSTPATGSAAALAPATGSAAAPSVPATGSAAAPAPPAPGPR